MKTEERTINVYITEDGKEFYNPFQCQEYEENISKIKRRKEFLNKTILDDMKRVPGIIEWPRGMNLKEQADWIDENLYIECEENRTSFYYLITEGNQTIKEEFDENCPFDISIWHKFEEEIKIKYGYTIEDSIYYWSK